jgi:hypothetical protein
MMLLTETRERFLLAIAGHVPVERIEEIHFFQPIRQGGVESGVAVVAAWPEVAAVEPASVPPAEEREARPVVYTARYRLTLKGPERGKWEASVVAEAVAPLVTVDAVVRGVQRRSGDADVATRMEGNDVRAILEAKAS